MRDVLVRYISEELLNRRKSPVAPDEDLLASGLLDSLGVMSLVFFIEETLGLEVPPEDVTIENFLSVRTIEDYLTRRKANTR
jgi:acyl carrier protein